MLVTRTMGERARAAYDSPMTIVERARALWPSSISVASAKRNGDTVTITSRPLFPEYPARLRLVVREGQTESDMTQVLPECQDRTWSIPDGEMRRALERQWKGIQSQMPDLDDKGNVRRGKRLT